MDQSSPVQFGPTPIFRAFHLILHLDRDTRKRDINLTAINHIDACLADKCPSRDIFMEKSTKYVKNPDKIIPVYRAYHLPIS
jgi:hypothetical protein